MSERSPEGRKGRGPRRRWKGRDEVGGVFERHEDHADRPFLQLSTVARRNIILDVAVVSKEKRST
jgi:hypothetical protein